MSALPEASAMASEDIATAISPENSTAERPANIQISL
jgi:hypothetical protein